MTDEPRSERTGYIVHHGAFESELLSNTDCSSMAHYHIADNAMCFKTSNDYLNFHYAESKI